MTHVTREVNQLPGIQSLRFVPRTKKATITYDPRLVTESDILAALVRANDAIVRANELTPAEIGLLTPGPDPAAD